MQIKAIYSHLNGLEFLSIRRPHLWDEIREIIGSANSESKKKGAPAARRAFGENQINNTLLSLLTARGWESGAGLLRQEHIIVNGGRSKRTRATGGIRVGRNFAKQRVAVQVHLSESACGEHDIFGMPLSQYVQNKIDVGIEILPMKSLQSQMSSGVAYFEGELYNVIRQGRGVPAVPLVMIGIVP